MENENEGLNVLMAEYEENVNVIAKINTELCKRHGLEYYLTEFSSNLIRCLNQYKRFVLMMPNRREFVEAILKFSESTIAFFEENKDKTKDSHDVQVEKMNDLVKNMNRINDIINSNYENAIKEYIND